MSRQQDAVVEQQGELIRFLQRRCDNLAREVLHLQTREDRRVSTAHRKFIDNPTGS